MVREAQRYARMILEDIGIDPTVLTMRRIAMHARRALSEAEMGSLSCEWLAIPALDEFSEDGEVEMRL